MSKWTGLTSFGTKTTEETIQVTPVKLYQAIAETAAENSSTFKKPALPRSKELSNSTGRGRGEGGCEAKERRSE
ncbi:hypothetical protein MSMTP_1116 [Methanosarcina sp. MTP4]|nr:hypothetical protein MSMTP_1116 [Methanosarcina sp. MTP4]